MRMSTGRGVVWLRVCQLRCLILFVFILTAIGDRNVLLHSPINTKGRNRSNSSNIEPLPLPAMAKKSKIVSKRHLLYLFLGMPVKWRDFICHYNPNRSPTESFKEGGSLTLKVFETKANSRHGISWLKQITSNLSRATLAPSLCSSIEAERMRWMSTYSLQCSLYPQFSIAGPAVTVECLVAANLHIIWANCITSDAFRERY